MLGFGQRGVKLFPSLLVSSMCSLQTFTSHLQIRLIDNLGKLSRILETDHFALVVHEQIQCKFFTKNTP